MKLAIISLTDQGKELAFEIKQRLTDDPTVIKCDLYNKQVNNTLKTIFKDYDCILGIMASAIMVRSLCKVIRDKKQDPAVLVMDEKANHVISLLSGHLGGANDYAYKIANLCRADPVITTATDVNNRMGIDSLARKYYFEIEHPGNILHINKALANGETVNLEVPEKFNYILADDGVKKSYRIISSNNNLKAVYQGCKVVLTPKKLVVGLGARKGVSTESVLEAVQKACKTLGITKNRIDYLATAEPKENEPGILEAANILRVPLKIVPLALLKNFKHPEVTESSFVQKKFGVPGICEPAALHIAGEKSHIVYCKTAFNRVTVAVSVSRK
jgi:cobalt-precorrin 5A hydrolase